MTDNNPLAADEQPLPLPEQRTAPVPSEAPPPTVEDIKGEPLTPQPGGEGGAPRRPLSTAELVWLLLVLAMILLFAGWLADHGHGLAAIGTLVVALLGGVARFVVALSRWQR